MSDTFLTGRLVTAGRFRPGEDKSTVPNAPEMTQKPVHETWVQEELEAVKSQSYDDLWKELQRRRREILRELEETAIVLRRRQEEMADALALFEEKCKLLRDTPPDSPETPDSAVLSHLKRELHEVSLELTICRNRQLETTASQSAHTLGEFSFAELIRIGLAVSLPVSIAILVGAIVLGIFGALVFGV